MKIDAVVADADRLRHRRSAIDAGVAFSRNHLLGYGEARYHSARFAVVRHLREAVVGSRLSTIDHPKSGIAETSIVAWSFRLEPIEKAST